MYLFIKSILLVTLLQFHDVVTGFQINHTLPLYTQQAVRCLSSIDREVQVCQSKALEYWKITPRSSLADSCCSRWDHLECSRDVLNKSDCSEQEKQDLSEWFANVEGFYANETCSSHTRHSPQCLNIMMSKLDLPELPTPPLPTPLAIDCLGNIKRDVRLECANVSEYKWNVTGHPPYNLTNICCSVWDDLDCLREIAWVRCMPIELAVTEEYFRKLINWTERAGCDQAPYHSDVCILPDDNKGNNLTIDMTIELVTSNTNELPEIIHVPEDTDIVIELVQTNSDEPPKILDVPDNFTSINLDNNNTNINMTEELTDTVLSEFTPSIDPPRPPQPDPLTIDCLGSIKRDVRLECDEVSKLRWNISTHTHPPLENVCCYLWDDIDCVREIAWVRCMPVELAHTEHYFNKVIDWAENVACLDVAPYHSGVCVLPTDIPEARVDYDLDQFMDHDTDQPNTIKAKTTPAKIKTTQSSNLPRVLTGTHEFKREKVIKIHPAHTEPPTPLYMIQHVQKLYPFSDEEHESHNYHGFWREFRAVFPLTMFFMSLIVLTLAGMIAVQYRMFRRNQEQSFMNKGLGGRVNPGATDDDDRAMLIRF